MEALEEKGEKLGVAGPGLNHGKYPMQKGECKVAVAKTFEGRQLPVVGSIP